MSKVISRCGDWCFYLPSSLEPALKRPLRAGRRAERTSRAGNGDARRRDLGKTAPTRREHRTGFRAIRGQHRSAGQCNWRLTCGKLARPRRFERPTPAFGGQYAVDTTSTDPPGLVGHIARGSLSPFFPAPGNKPHQSETSNQHGIGLRLRDRRNISKRVRSHM